MNPRDASASKKCPKPSWQALTPPGKRGKKVPQTIQASLFNNPLPLTGNALGNNTIPKGASLIFNGKINDFIEQKHIKNLCRKIVFYEVCRHLVAQQWLVISGGNRGQWACRWQEVVDESYSIASKGFMVTFYCTPLYSLSTDGSPNVCVIQQPDKRPNLKNLTTQSTKQYSGWSNFSGAKYKTRRDLFVCY